MPALAMRSDPPPRDVSEERSNELFKEKLAQKRDYGNLSTSSKIVEDPMAGHHVHLQNPQTVVTAICDVLDSVQQHTPLLP
jgi:hypothetical protein